MTMQNNYDDVSFAPPPPDTEMPVSVQILSTLLFGAFAIPVTLVALNIFWPAGIAIAVILAWRGGFAPCIAPRSEARTLESAIKTVMPATSQRPSGNASFDAYRNDMIERLEVEQSNFEGFLTRLRDAKDQMEFDAFLDERARNIDAQDGGTDAPKA